MGLGAAAIPGFCSIMTVGAVIEGVNSVNNAMDNFAQGNNYTAALDVLGAIGAFAGAARGNCFVAGTRVVRYVGLPNQLADAESDDGVVNDPRGWNGSYLALAIGSLLVAGWLPLATEAKRRREEEAARRLLFGEIDEGADDNEGDPSEPWSEDLLADPPHQAEPASAADWHARVDQLCDDLFNGPAGDDALPLVLTGPPMIEEPANLPVSAWRLASTGQSTDRQIAHRSPPTEPRIKPSRQSPTATAHRGARLQWSAACLLLCGLFLWLARPGANAPAETVLTGNLGLASAAAPDAEVDAEPQYVTTNIEDLRVGDWVLARNPEVSDAERAEAVAVDPANWRKLTLRLAKEEGGHVDIELLRPAAMVDELALKPGDQLDLELVELNAAGWADVLAVEACPATGPPPSEGCQVVTGRYVHSSADTLDLRIAALGDDTEEVIGVTAVHPFWSEDRGAFIAAGDLKPGELLLTASGDLAQVISLTPRAAAEPVYNLEVNTEHVYYVSNTGVLVHNTYSAKSNKVPNPNGKRGGTPHQNKVAQVIADIKSRNLDFDIEFRVATINGKKKHRFMDVVAMIKGTKTIVEVHQIGRMLKSNRNVPVSRERTALRDVRHSTELRGAKRFFHEY